MVHTVLDEWQLLQGERWKDGPCQHRQSRCAADDAAHAAKDKAVFKLVQTTSKAPRDKMTRQTDRLTD